MDIKSNIPRTEKITTVLQLHVESPKFEHTGVDSRMVDTKGWKDGSGCRDTDQEVYNFS